jgi:hypothetical protein
MNGGRTARPDGLAHRHVPEPTLDIAIRKVAPQTPRRWPTCSARVRTRVERDEPVGRLIALVVDAHARGWASGARSSRMSRNAPAARAASSSTSAPATAARTPRLLRRLGFDDASRRFVKDLTPDEASGPSTPR